MNATKGVPVVLDLCCGGGGWSAGFMAAHWNAIGIDNVVQPDYPGAFVCADILTWDPAPWIGLIDFVVSSSPCTSFSEVWNFSRLPRPCTELGKALFHRCFEIADLLGVAIVAENVRGAVPFIGGAKAHAGSFYLWGDVPAILPTEKFIKGCWHDGATARGRKWTKKGNARARIPFDLAYHIARTAQVSGEVTR
jgi:hypothetical protein